MSIFKLLPGGDLLGYAIDGATAYSTYREDKSKGVNEFAAAGHGLVDFALWRAFSGPLLALQIMPAIPAIQQALSNQTAAMQRNIMPMTPFDRYQNTPKAQTTRARAMQAIQSSRTSAMQFIGHEAGAYAARYR